MADETFAQATMRKMRALEDENRRLRKENEGLHRIAQTLRNQIKQLQEIDTWADMAERMRRFKPYRHLCTTEPTTP